MASFLFLKLIPLLFFINNALIVLFLAESDSSDSGAPSYAQGMTYYQPKEPESEKEKESSEEESDEEDKGEDKDNKV